MIAVSTLAAVLANYPSPGRSDRRGCDPGDMDRYEEAALAAVNDVLARVGGASAERLDPGHPGKPSACVIGPTVGRTNPELSILVGGGALVAFSAARETDVCVELGAEARRFVERFDGGEYPHLIACRAA